MSAEEPVAHVWFNLLKEPAVCQLRSKDVCLLDCCITDELKPPTFSEMAASRGKTDITEGFGKIQSLPIDIREAADCSLVSS